MEIPRYNTYRPDGNPLPGQFEEIKMDWMDAVVGALKQKLIFALELTGDQSSAIDYVKKQSIAGDRAWQIALSDLHWKC